MAIDRLISLRWAAVLLPGAFLYFFPAPGFEAAQRHLLALFLATIVALVARPAPMGVSVLLAMTLAALTRAVPAARVLSGFANQTVWLIFAAFLFSRAIRATGCWRRLCPPIPRAGAPRSIRFASHLRRRSDSGARVGRTSGLRRADRPTPE